MTPLPALLVSPDFLPGQGGLNGRRFAANQLLRQWGHMSGSESVALLGPDESTLDSYRDELSAGGHQGSVSAVSLIDPSDLLDQGALFTPDPALGLWSKWRWPLGPTSFSIIGQTHTLASKAAIDHLDSLGTDALGPWDALICSSRAGASVAQQLLEMRLEQLQSRYGFKVSDPKKLSPQLPVIPLSIDVSGLQSSLPNKSHARKQLGIPDNAKVVLWIGRLSLLTKLDPWPQYQMLNRLARYLDQPLYLVEVGQDDTPDQGNHFKDLRKLCPYVHFLQLGGTQPASESQKYLAMASADIALSLVDNVQETFGLSVAEAMAAGLPVVASNWDGYRDSVRDGLDGFLIPTRWAPISDKVSPGLGWLHQIGVIPYTAFAASLAQLVHVDMDAALSAILLLLTHSHICDKMGSAAARRASERFDRPQISSQYLDLFGRLAEERKRFDRDTNSSNCLPNNHWRAVDPVHLFQSFASHTDTISFIDSTDTPPSVVQQGRSGIWHFLRLATPLEYHDKLQDNYFAKHF